MTTVPPIRLIYRRLIVLLLAAATPVAASAQSQYTPYYFRTLAGRTDNASMDGVRSAAAFRAPLGAAVDSAGNAYVADTANQTIRKISPVGVVSTLAGMAGVSGSSNGIGSAARFSGPGGVAVDAAGNVYVADTGTHTIRKITPAGVVSTLAGMAFAAGSVDGTGAAARFRWPRGLGVDPAGNIYVADSDNHTVRIVTPAGAVTTLAGAAGVAGSNDGAGSAARFNFPLGVSVDSSGGLYVADYSNHTVRKITPAGVVSTLAGAPGGPGAADGSGSGARFNGPFGVTVRSPGQVYVVDSGNHTIRKIAAGGVVTTLAGSAGAVGSDDGVGNAARFRNPSHLAVDSGGTLFVAESGNNTIRKITPDALVSTFAGFAPSRAGSRDGTGGAAQFNSPSGAAVDNGGNVYVADEVNHTIRKITSDGVVTTLTGIAGLPGSEDGAPGFAQFNYPANVAIDTAGNLYVGDSSNHTIRKIGPNAEVTTFAGRAGFPGSTDGSGAVARFRRPAGVAADGAGNVYVGDTFNSTIRKITPAGVVSTLAGLAGSTGSADGTGAAARFNHMQGVAVDSAGFIYVADSGNQTIRKISPAGVTTTLAGLAGAGGSTDGTGSSARFQSPIGVAVDAHGDAYVAESVNRTIRKISPSGVVTTVAGMPGVGVNPGGNDGTGSAAKFAGPSGIAVDAEGKLYVTDGANNHTIRIGDNLPVALNEAASLKVHGNGRVFAVDLPVMGVTGVECRRGNVDGAHTLVFNFNHDLANAHATVTGGTGKIANEPLRAGAQLAVDLTGVTNNQILTVTLSNVVDHLGSTLPNTSMSASFVFGDTTSNGFVNASDISHTKSVSGETASAVTFRTDVNVSGSTNATDIALVKGATAGAGAVDHRRDAPPTADR